jgi:hypothetical protein
MFITKTACDFIRTHAQRRSTNMFIRVFIYFWKKAKSTHVYSQYTCMRTALIYNIFFLRIHMYNKYE